MNYYDYRVSLKIEYVKGGTELLNLCLDRLEITSIEKVINHRNIFTKDIKKVEILSVIIRNSAKYDKLKFLVIDSQSKPHHIGFDLKVPITEFEAFDKIKNEFNINPVVIKPILLELDSVNYLDKVII